MYTPIIMTIALLPCFMLYRSSELYAGRLRQLLNALYFYLQLLSLPPFTSNTESLFELLTIRLVFLLTILLVFILHIPSSLLNLLLLIYLLDHVCVVFHFSPRFSLSQITNFRSFNLVFHAFFLAHL